MLANQLGDSDIADVSNFYKSLMDKKSVPIESLITSYDWEIKAKKNVCFIFRNHFYVIFYYEYTRRNDERPVLRGAAGFSWLISDLFKPIGEALHNGYQSRKSRKIQKSHILTYCFEMFLVFKISIPIDLRIFFDIEVLSFAVRFW